MYGSKSISSTELSSNLGKEPTHSSLESPSTDTTASDTDANTPPAVEENLARQTDSIALAHIGSGVCTVKELILGAVDIWPVTSIEVNNLVDTTPSATISPASFVDIEGTRWIKVERAWGGRKALDEMSRALHVLGSANRS